MNQCHSVELKFYILVAISFTVGTLYIAYTLSSETHPNHHLYHNLLTPGWIFNRKIDNSDSQYASFRNNIPILFLSMLGHISLSSLSKRLNCHRSFSIIFSLIFLTILHGSGVLKILILLSLHYFLFRKFGYMSSWIFAISFLFLNQYFKGYTFFIPTLDSFKGIQSRWWLTFNFSTLRMISFAMDCSWRKIIKSRQSLSIDKEDSRSVHPTLKSRVETPLDELDYSFLNYMMYTLYIPLFMAGPIITFNDFTRQRQSPPVIHIKRCILYSLRWFTLVISMECFLHYIYVIAISKQKAWSGLFPLKESIGSFPLFSLQGFSPLQASVFGLYQLFHVWFKLSIIWKFFRLWAMLDSIETIENMKRCMTNNYSMVQFWRDWHCSFNRWTVIPFKSIIYWYLYIPLGGKQYAFYNTWVIFTFVAIWHDISMNLFVWGWLIALFLLPEMISTHLYPVSWKSWKYFRIIKGIGCVFNILLMMAANLVGYAIGMNGTLEIAQKIFTFDGVYFVVGACFTIFCGTQIMFEIRERERLYRKESIE